MDLMNMTYTSAVKEGWFALLDQELQNIWADIENLRETKNEPERWRLKLQGIAKEYTLSSRFALMRLLQARPEYINTHPGVPVEVHSIEQAQSLEPDTLQQYEDWLLQIAKIPGNPAARKSAKARIRKALQISPKRKKDLCITRAEAFELGHLLRFTLAEMEWFLLRVCNVEGGFRYNSSADLIEAYGFLTECSAAQVAQLQELYEIRAADIPKEAYFTKPNGWTQNVKESLPTLVEAWSKQEFLNWMCTLAPHLDTPSQSAIRIYRNIAAFALEQLQSEQHAKFDRQGNPIETEPDFCGSVCHLSKEPSVTAAAKKYFFTEDVLDLEGCIQSARILRAKNFFLTDDPASEMFIDPRSYPAYWHVIDVRTDGQMTPHGGINTSTRLKDILTERERFIDKSDMLYLLWFTANVCWSKSEIEPDANVTCSRLFDFLDAADCVLAEAGLPPFYPPHLVEQSMMLSLLYTHTAPEYVAPAVIYEQICNAVIERRPKRKEVQLP